jgi:hypothetical protein
MMSNAEAMAHDDPTADAEAEAWALRELADAAREVPFEHQPERLQLALARLIPLRSPFPATAAGPASQQQSE